MGFSSFLRSLLCCCQVKSEDELGPRPVTSPPHYGTTSSTIRTTTSEMSSRCGGPSTVRWYPDQRRKPGFRNRFNFSSESASISEDDSLVVATSPPPPPLPAPRTTAQLLRESKQRQLALQARPRYLD
ncbi:hypothetical protein BGZ60DRAFT_428761 [Tricladium varicosporioides]|nr:hypothetical protein BGZ60DRAFT_428761 [Hymenoscyphus varicosporioides]